MKFSIESESGSFKVKVKISTLKQPLVSCDVSNLVFASSYSPESPERFIKQCFVNKVSMELEGFARCGRFAGWVRFAASLLPRWLRSAAAAEHRPLSASRTQTTGDGEGHIEGNENISHSTQ